MAISQVKNDSFQQEVLNYKGTVLVDFYADWCGPCKVVSPILDELAESMKNIKFAKVNVDENQELAAKYSVFSIPTFLIFKDGEVKNQFVGAHSKEGFEEEIEKVTTS